MKLSHLVTSKTIIKTVNAPGKQRSSENGTDNDKKEEFFRHGTLPKSRSEKLPKPGEGVRKKKHVSVSLEYLVEAKRILDTVNEKYQSGDRYLEEVFGKKISQAKATKYLVEYMKSEGLDGALRIIWSSEIDCCGRIICTGPRVHLNRPEKRRYSLWLKSTGENVFLRQQGIKGLADHEIGTHYLRTLNDGFQPWYTNRKLFGLRGLTDSRHLKATEEGFAAINTLLQLNCRLLWWPAFLYYTACMSIKMTFQELFDHLTLYIRDPDQRWKHVMRVKRDLEDCSGYGGSGRDQAYFEGAVKILREAKEIDFKLLYSGKLCFDELKRVKRVRRASIKLPHFMQDITVYRHALHEICYTNDLQPPSILQHVYQKRITQEPAKVSRQRKRPTQRLRSGKLKSRKSQDKSLDERGFSNFVNCDVFAIKSPPI